jgi:lysophospholipase L1-like esterase
MTLIPFIILVIVLIVSYKQFEKSFFNKPSSYPEFAKLNREGKPIFIAFGDSLTQANMSADWLEIMAGNRPDIQFLNAGMNADLTETLLTRIEDIVACQPHLISLIIGSNDVMATLTPERMKRYYRLGKITEDANYERFMQNYREIVAALSSQTTAKIIVASLPPITEDFSFEGNQQAEKYSAFIKNISDEYGLIYLPFREALLKNMTEKSDQLNDFTNADNIIRKAVIRKKFLGQSWNEIAASRKAKYMTDNIHLNDDAAGILAGLMLNEIN